MNSNFKIDLTVGYLRKKTMSLSVYVNDFLVWESLQPLPPKIHIDFDHALPVTLTFKVWEKDQFDTEVDAHGNILADKFVQIDSVMIDSMPIPKWLLESQAILFDQDRGGSRHTNYLGSNGAATLSIPHQDSFDYFLNLLSKKS